MSDHLNSLAVLSTEKAHALLEEAIARIPEERQLTQLSEYSNWVKLQREMMIFTVHGIHEDLTKNVLAFRPIGTNDMIEAVLNVQGYLVETDLPPLLQKQKIASRPGITSQRIVLSAVNSAQFNEAIAACHQINTLFSTACPTGTLRAWTPSLPDGHKALELSTRYYSYPKEGDIIEAVPKNIDPQRFLQQNGGPNRKYTTDNVVNYYEEITSPDGSSTYPNIDPLQICAGQLVDVQVRFETRAIKSKRPEFALRICSICILDRSIQMDVLQQNTRNPVVTQSLTRPSLKRAVGYPPMITAGPQKKAKTSKSRLEDETMDVGK